MALLLASSVMAGLGVLLSVPITAGLAGSRSWLAWSVHLVTGGLVCFGLGLLARLSGSTGGVVDLVAGLSGALGGRVLTTLYLAGFIVGQAAIVLTAGRFGAYVLGRSDSAAVVVGAAAATVVVAAATAATVPRVPAAVQHWRIGVAWTVGLALSANPVLLRGSGLLPAVDARQFWPAVFLLLFAGVGWEQSARLAPGLRDTRELLWAVAVGVALISGGYFLAGTMAGSVGLSGSTWPSGVSVALAGMVTILLASFCLTNIQTAVGLLHALAPRRPAGQLGRVMVIGASILVILVAGTRASWEPYQLLAGPAVAVWLIYMVALGSGFRSSGVGVRLVLVVPSALLVLTASTATWSLIS